MPSRVRLPDPVVETARRAGAASGRDPEAQLDHWVRLGRAIERSGLYTHLQISGLLARDRASGDPSP